MNDPTVRPKLMFPKITRKDADKDLKHFFQYLFNYGFYKFGVEVIIKFTQFGIKHGLIYIFF